jgi:hypothetical protein
MGAGQLFLEVFVAAEHVEAGDHERMLLEGVTHRGLYVLAGEDGEGEAELHAQLVLPLLDEVARRDDQAAFQVAPDNEFLYEETCHDRLSCAGVVGEQEAQGLAP